MDSTVDHGRPSPVFLHYLTPVTQLGPWGDEQSHCHLGLVGDPGPVPPKVLKLGHVQTLCPTGASVGPQQGLGAVPDQDEMDEDLMQVCA